ncbi:MAG: aminodeoxychorismate lyase [Colwellia sp.]|nr:aminodeoxychorismate lyase [Colwellia sp.]MCW9081068.1 aminodeoxychorismate lyase [Colwellia sp.]
MKFCLVNGVQENHIGIDNRGLAYGDGIFTTAKIVNGQVQYLSAHVKRLLLGCEKLLITPPKQAELTKQLVNVAKEYSLAVLKVIITAKSGGRGYARSKDNGHDLLIMVHDYPAHYDEKATTGVQLAISQHQLGLNPMLAGLKHLNRLEQVLLRDELSNRTEDDLLVTNLNGEVIEATSANVFFIINGKLYTPDLSQSGVKGLMRQAILQRYPETSVKSLSLDEIVKAEEIFICNCVMGIMPVATFNGKALTTTRANGLRSEMEKAVISHD